MIIRSFVAQTLRAMCSGIAHPLPLPNDIVTQEAACAYALMGWSSMREPYKTACILAMLVLCLHTFLLYRRRPSLLTPSQMANVLARWMASPLPPLGDFVRAMTMFFLMGSFDQKHTWDNVGLEGYDSYRDMVRLYHDFPSL